jgi:integrase
MPRIAKLDSKTIAGLTLADDKLEDIYFDARLPGHGLRLRRREPLGAISRIWITQYFTTGRTRRVTHGAVNKLTPAQAFEASRQILAKVALGDDPQGDKIAHRQAAAKTFRIIVDEYLMARASELRPASLRIAKLYLGGPYFRWLHPLPISNVTHADVAECIRMIEREHSSHTAAAARRALSTFFGWAIGEALMGANPVNPVIGTRTPAGAPARDHVLSIDELIAVWHACEDDDYGCIIRLLILTGARANEIGGICQSELNLDAGTWHLPKERSKNHRAHQIVLPRLARNLLQRVAPTMGRDQLFGNRAAGFTGWPQAKTRLDQRLGDSVRSWRVHDLRRSAATHMGDLGIAPHIIEACLNHYSGHRRGVGGVYNRARYDREVTAALERWARHIDAMVSGVPSEQDDKIVQLRA